MHVILEKKTETIGVIRVIQGVYRDYREYIGVLLENGKENGNY